MDKIKFIWIIGICAGIFLIIGKVIEKYTFNKYVKMKEQERLNRIDSLKKVESGE